MGVRGAFKGRETPSSRQFLPIANSMSRHAMPPLSPWPSSDRMTNFSCNGSCPDQRPSHGLKKLIQSRLRSSPSPSNWLVDHCGPVGWRRMPMVRCMSCSATTLIAYQLIYRSSCLLSCLVCARITVSSFCPADTWQQRISRARYLVSQMGLPWNQPSY
ncbi:unannotated protein [freshwater metagenome]|uniref:Unannotated protein n=1 Tax=freshwater metagenome TaxID=449393 RepID=A0A6J6WL10_9ZZZZ